MTRLSFFLAVALAVTPVLGATLDELAWMSGEWRSESGGSSSEEVWTEPAGGVMLAVHRDIRPDGSAFFEFLRIEERRGAIAYIAQPGGRPPTAFPLKSIEGSKVTFENPDHDFPQRIIYWREDDELCGRVEGTMDGKAASDQWCWKRK